jgi:predicted RND superfamily exporter protein
MVRFADGFVGLLERRHVRVTLICLGFMILCGAGLPGIKSTVKLQDRFLPSHEVIADYRWLETQLGPMVPLECVLRFRDADKLDILHQLQTVGAVQRGIDGLPETGATLSAVNLTPPIPSGGGLRQVVQRRMLNKRLRDARQSLVDTRFLADDGDSALWRISVRASAIGSLDYGRLTDRLRANLDQYESDPNIELTITGVIPLIYKAQRQLLQDLVVSFLAAFAVIFLVMIGVLRSIPAAIVAMIANLFPAVIVFGAMSWARVPVQIGSVMTASAALGIAVDDTVHFLTWFRRGLDEGQTRGEALRTAFERCAGAMMHTTVICSCGLIVFALSSFVPILHFTWLMVFLLLMALVGDLILLPSMLAGPLGWFFERPARREGADSSPEVSSFNGKP